MADFRITELPALASADLTATDPLAVVDVSASDTKKITAKAFTEKAVTLIDDASIPVAKVNLSGISGTNLTDGTVTAAKLNTSTIPATGGLAVSSGNLGLVAPTGPIVRNGATGSLEHAVSGATAGTYTKVTVDAKGHVTTGSSVAAADLPVAVSGTVGVMSPGTGLTVTGGGVLNHSSSITAGTTSGFTYNAQGHITGAVALAGADLPVATSSVIGGTRPGTGLTVDGSGILSLSAATNSVLGGVIAGSDFAVSSGTISLATQGGIAAGVYPKVTVTTKGIVTAGASLVASDIPNLDANKITTGTFSANLYGTNSITGVKLANYSTVQFGGAGSTSGVVTFPVAQFTGQGFFDSINGDYYLFDGNAWQPLTVISGDLVYAGTYNASTNTVATCTTAGIAAGLTVGSALPAPSASLNRYYIVVAVNGTGTSPAPTVALAAPDMLICSGTSWDKVGTSSTVAGVSTATGISFSTYGNITGPDVQTAIQELEDEKLAKVGGVITGELLIGTAGTFGFEGSTANAYETYLSAVDPTADRAIVFPDASGTVALSGAIVNADINASAAIAYSKLALGTSIVNADINVSAAISGTKIQAASTSNVGVVQLIDSSSSASTTTAPTANALKTVADSISALMPKAGGAFTGDVTLNSQSDLKFADSDSSNWVALQAPATVAANLTFTLPAVDGSAGQALVTNGSGALGWATAGDLSTTGGTMTGRLNFISYSETTSTSSISGGTVTFNLNAASVFNVTLNSNITTITITNAQASKSSAFTIFFTGDGTTRTINWGSIRWAWATAPLFTFTNGKVNIVSLVTNDGGTTWFAFDCGGNF